MRAIVRKVDFNQPAIVECLRKLGFSVAMTHIISKGFPDIVIAKNNKTRLAEIKDGSLAPSRRRLTPEEARFHALWNDKILIIESIEDCLLINENWDQRDIIWK